MQSIPDMIRRMALVLFLVVVALRVVCGEMVPMGTTRPPSPARPPRGLEWRFLRPIGRRLVGVQVRILIA